MKTFLTLDVVGILAALILGGLILVFGGLEAFFVLLFFLVISAVVSRVGKARKNRMKGYEMVRGWKNVLANGAVPLVLSFAYFLIANFNFGPVGLAVLTQNCIIVGFIASVAAITADKFSSELGIFDENVVMLVSLKRVHAGISGGVSVLGTVAGFVGALLVASFAVLLFLLGALSLPIAAVLILLVSLAGLVGDMVDSVAGYFEEKGLGNKFSSNILCAASGALFGMAVFLLVSQVVYLM